MEVEQIAPLSPINVIANISSDYNDEEKIDDISPEEADPNYESEDKDLPEGWSIKYHKNTLPFFFHKDSGVVVWTKPYVRKYRVEVRRFLLFKIIKILIKDHTPPLSAFKIITKHHEKEKREAEKEKREEARKQLELSLVQSVNASLALSEATAKAVQRIPDAHCNGDMHDALEYAAKVKHDQREFLQKQGIENIF